jgi:tetratricopeptide (TPR) repeat protein
MTQLQRDFLDKALSFYDEVASEQPTDLAAGHAKAMAIYRTFEIELALGRREKALERVERAHGQLSRAIEWEPDNRQFLSDLANMSMTRGVLLVEMGKVDAGVASIEDAIEHWNELAERFPREPKYRVNGAHARMNLGSALADDPAKGERLLREAITTYKSLIDDEHKVPERSVDLARASVNLSNILSAQKRAAESVTVLDVAIAQLQRIADVGNATQESRELLFGLYNAMGLTLLELNRCAEALAPLEKARAILESLVADFPEIPRHRDRLATSVPLVDKLRTFLSSAPGLGNDSQSNNRLLEELGNLKIP